MLICFGAAWPFSIRKSLASRANDGKSLTFLWTVLVGYAAGVTHKVLHSPDWVTYLYVFNGVMVLLDIGLYYRNTQSARRVA
jgi:hypothetical protein